MWITVVAALLSIMGSSLKNTVQVYFVPMASSLNESRGEFAFATTLFAVTYAVASPIVGTLSDRLGPVAVLRGGILLTGATFLGMASTGSAGIFTVVYGAFGAFAYAALAYVPIGVLVDRVFPPERKGFFFALLTNGTAVGFIVLVPAWIWLGTVVEWQSVLRWLAVAFFVFLLPLSFTFRVPAPTSTVKSTGPTQAALSSLKTLRNGPFVSLALAFLACGVTMAFVDVHLISHLHDARVPGGAISSSMVVLGVAEVLGAFAAGIACDRGHIRTVLLAAYALRGTSILILAVAPTAASAQVFGLVFGASFLMTVVATTIWLVSSYPGSIRGFVLGLLWAVHQAGAALSSQVGAFLRDLTGGYAAIIYVGSATCLLSVFLVAALPDPVAQNHNSSKV